MTGCAGIIREAAKDPAIVVSTGFYLSFGLNPAPEVGGMPLPNIKIGYGTISRIGGNRDVTITVGTATDIKQGEESAMPGGTPTKNVSIPTLGSRASLHITAKDSGYITPEKPKKERKQRATKANEKPTVPASPKP